MSVTLEGAVVLVAGGAGQLGEGLVRAFAGADARVVVPVRSRKGLEAFHARMADAGEAVTPVLGNVGDVQGAMAVRAEVLERFGRVDTVVAALGRWRQEEPLLETAPDVWDAVLQENLTAHFLCARTFLPVLERVGGAYCIVSGPAGEAPEAGSGPMCVAAAGQRMLAGVLRLELAGRPVRLYEMRVPQPVRTRDHDPGRAEQLSALEVGHAAVFLASDAEGLWSGHSVRLETLDDLDELGVVREL